jgi:hypothetical protein
MNFRDYARCFGNTCLLIHTHMSKHVYIYIYIYIWRKRKRKETKRKNDNQFIYITMKSMDEQILYSQDSVIVEHATQFTLERTCHSFLMLFPTSIILDMPYPCSFFQWIPFVTKILTSLYIVVFSSL